MPPIRFFALAAICASLALSAVATLGANAASAAPTARFTYSPTSPVTGQAVTFDATSSECTDGPCTYAWSDDGSITQPLMPLWPLGSGQKLSFTFHEAATKYVRLLVTDASGQTATVEHDVIVKEATSSPPPPPTARFIYAPATPVTGIPVTFDASGSECPDEPCTYAWSDDGSSIRPSTPLWPLGSGQKLSFTFHEAATKYVRLLVTDASGQTATVEHDVIVNEATSSPPPSAPINTVLPVISGTTIEGQSLLATKGEWSGNPTSYVYQWQDCDTSGEACTNLSGATGSSYTLGSGDVGRTVRVVVTAANAGGSTSAVSGRAGVVTAVSSGGAGCTITVSSLSAVNGDLTSGAVVCLTAGTYGSLTLTANPASNATLTAAPGAHVVLSGVQVGGKHLTVSQLHSTGGIEVISGGGNDVIEHNDVTDPKGYGVSVLCTRGCAASDIISNVTISGNEIHGTDSTGEGDALRFDGWSNITVKENDVYNIRECASDTCHTDTLQSYQAGIPTSGLTLERNYIHDCIAAQGFPFLKDGDVSNVTISDNLALRMSSNNEITGMFVDDNSVGLSITNNTYQGTSGSDVQSEGSASNPTVAVNHNVFDSFNVPAGKYALTEDYDIFTANNEWSFSLGAHSVKNSSPGFVNPSTDDYRLASNPNHIGIDWSPSTQQYGPIS
jgi:hypothetical protein